MSKSILPSRHVRSATNRQASCTHISMTRLYNTDGPVLCQLCHNNPSFGWVYHCVQDHNGYLPISRFSDLEQEPSKRRIRDNSVLKQLSLPIIKAIEQGCYTDEQISTLVKQKINVRRAVLLQARCEQTPSNSTSSEDNSDTSKFEEDPENTATTMSSMAMDEELRKSESTTTRFARSIKSRLKDILTVGTVLPRSTSDLLPECHALPTCNFTACHKCRPTYRDRAYGCLNQILASDPQLPPIWELENRPVADARILSQIGLSPIHESEAHDQSVQHDLSHSHSQSTIADSDRGRQVVYHSVRSRSGFRAAVRKALEQAIYSSRSHSNLPKPNGSSKDSSRDSSSTRIGRPTLFRRKRIRDIDSTPYLVVDGAQMQDALLLTIAINTPLPEVSDDTESLVGWDLDNASGLAGAEDMSGSRPADLIAQS